MATRKRDSKYWKPAPAGGRYYGGGSTPAPARNTKSAAPSASAKTTVVKTAAAKQAAAKSAAKSGVKKAAAAEVAGGGPEDPVADVAAAGSLLGSLKSGAGKAKDKAPDAGKAFSASNPRRWVMVEFLVCFVILGLGTIVAPAGKKNGGASHLAVKGSALALLFFILGLMSGGGPKAAKAAGALGGLVTAAYVFTSQDSANLVLWISDFFDSGKAASSSGSTTTGAPATPGTPGGGSTGLGGLGTAIGQAAGAAAGAAQ